MDELTYLKMFHSIVTSGIICGLKSPVEWWMNTYRNNDNVVLGANRYFNEMYSSVKCEEPTPEKVEEWLKGFYRKDHFFKESFDATLIEAYRYKENT